MITPIPFGEWLPDTPNYLSPGCVVAENCKPAPGGYGPFLGPNSTGEDAAGVCKGAKLLFRSTGAPVVVGGTDTSLFVIVGGVTTEVTGLSSMGDNYWTFVQFNQFVVAIGAANAPRYLTALDSDTTFGTLGGSPPTAATGGRVGNYLMLGNVTGNPFQVSWSAENDITNWTPSVTTGAGSAELQHEYGKITGFGGDRFPVLFQEYAVTRVTPNVPTVFRFDTIEEARGCIAPGSIVTVGFMTYFLAHDGFCVTDGNTVQRIGQNKVDDWFFANASDADKFRTHGAIDWENQCVVWAFYPALQSAFARLLIYSWEQNRWSTATLTVHRLVESSIGETTIEELDALYGDLDSVPVSLDSALFAARGRVLSAFIGNGSDTLLHTLNGTALQADFETAEHQPQPGSRTFIYEVHPLVENLSVNSQARVITRNPKGGPEIYGTFGTVNDGGFCPVRADGRYVRVGLRIPAGAIWSKAQGVSVRHRVSGRR